MKHFAPLPISVSSTDFVSPYDRLASLAAQAPSALALNDPLGRVDRAELMRRIDCGRRVLQAAGQGPKSRVAAVSHSAQALARLIPAIACHCAAMPIDPALGASTLVILLRRAGITAVVADGVGIEPIREAADQLGLPCIETVDGHWGDSTACLPLTSPMPLPEPSDILWILATSGSTGTPKLVPRTRQSVALRFNGNDIGSMEGETVTITAQPMHHAGGLLRLFNSLLRGDTYVAMGRFDYLEFAHWARATSASFLSSTPLVLTELLHAARSNPEPLGDWRPKHILFASACLPDRVALDLIEWSGAQLDQRYGSTEATGIASCRLEPATLASDIMGRPALAEVRIATAQGEPLATCVIGEIQVRGPTVFEGYLDDAELNRERFIDGWFRIGDLGYLDAKGLLHLCGRQDDVINRGGAKVSIREVEAWLLECPEVAIAAAFAAPHPTLGQDVLAAVVGAGNARPDGDALRRRMLDELSGYKVPSRIVTVESLPLGPAGKVRKEGLAERLANAFAVAPRSPTSESELLCVALIAELLNVESVGVDENFFMAGGHSLLAVRLMQTLSERTGRHIPVSHFMGSPTAADLARLLDEAAQIDRHPQIEPFRTQGGDAPLFVAPGFWGNPFYILKLLDHLPPSVPVYGLHAPPEAEHGENPVMDVARHSVRLIREIQPQGPYRLTGYSAGGVVAQAICCLIEAQGEAVELLMLIDSPCPGENRTRAPSHQRAEGEIGWRSETHQAGLFSGKTVLIRSGWRPLDLLSRPGRGWEHCSESGVICHDVLTTHRGIVMGVHCARVGEIISAHLTTQDVASSPAMAPDEVVPFQPRDADPQATPLGLAITAASQARFDAALVHLAAVDQRPSNMHLLALARVLWTWQAGDVRAAERALDTLEALTVGAPDLYALVHQELNRVGWWAAAKRYCDLTLFLASPPSRADTLLSNAEAAWVLGMHTQFVTDMQEAMACSPDEPYFPLRYVAGLTQMGYARQSREATALALMQFGDIAGFKEALAVSLKTPSWTRKEKFKASLRRAALMRTPSWVKGRWWMPFVAGASFSQHAPPKASQPSSFRIAGIRPATAPMTVGDS